MDIPGKGSRDWWNACYFYASCTFAGSELWVTGEVRYLPDGRSSGEKRWHLLALSWRIWGRGREDSIFLLLLCPSNSSFSQHLILKPFLFFSDAAQSQKKKKNVFAKTPFWQIPQKTQKKQKKKKKKKHKKKGNCYFLLAAPLVGVSLLPLLGMSPCAPVFSLVRELLH